MLLLLIRHAHTDAVGVRLAGRAPGHPLSAAGRAEAARLAQRLAALPLRAVYSSPVERANETAAAIAALHGLPVTPLDGIQELDFGEWTGRSFDELAADPLWGEWNEQRGSARIPGGESMAEAQHRAAAALAGLAPRHAEELVAAVTHADIVRGVLAYWLGMPLDRMLRLEIAPASTTGVRLGAGEPQVLWVNDAEGPGRAAGQ